MNKISTASLALFVFILLVFVVAPEASAQSTDSLFQQAVTDYQRSPSQASAERVIRLAADMDELPPIPEEARKHYVMGTTLLKDAKSPDDFNQVMTEFSEAIWNAPWWREAYYNLGLTYEAAGKYEDAIGQFNLYQLFKLPYDEARKVRDRIYGIEAKQEKAKRDAALAEKQRREEQIRANAEAAARVEKERLNSFEGGWYVEDCRKGGETYSEPISSYLTITKQGDVYFVSGAPWCFDNARYHLTGRILTAKYYPTLKDLKSGGLALPEACLEQAVGKFAIECNLTLSEDGHTISADADNYSIECENTTQFLVTTSQYKSANRIPEWFTMTLARSGERETPSVRPQPTISRPAPISPPTPGYWEVYFGSPVINSFKVGNDLTKWFGASVGTHKVFSVGFGFAWFYAPSAFHLGFGMDIFSRLDFASGKALIMGSGSSLDHVDL